MSALDRSPADAEERMAAQAHLTALAGPSAVLREDQWRAIEALLHGRTVEVVQRTGWGKSAVYWVATALLRARGSGLALVISPLLALMRDQVAAATRAGLRAVTLNSANLEQWPDLEQQVAADEVDVLLISPERLNSPGFRSRVMPGLAPRLGLVVIDESHCLSDWGHDFRPDYRRLAGLLAALPVGTPVLATTATANERVSRDVAAQLGADTLTLRGSLDRQSLVLSVVSTADLPAAYGWIAAALSDGLPGSGIVYTLTVEQTERLAAFLRTQGHSVQAYSSATEPARRHELETALRNHELRALVATSSLGMGLDMPDLAFVLHLGAPSSPIAYYQQVGRAGRALERAEAVLLPITAQDRIWAYFDSTAFPPEPTVRRVLDALAGGALSVARLEIESGLRRGRLESLLKVLDVDGAVTRTPDGWTLTGSPWHYDRERHAGVAAARGREQQVMRDYQAGGQCLMRVLRSELDDPDADACSRCSVCTGRLPSPGDTVPAGLVEAALRHLRADRVVLEPRKMWPSGATRRGRIPEPLRAEPGRALARADDEVWQRALGPLLDGRLPLTDEVSTGVIDTLSAWRTPSGWPAGRPTWVTWVPSRRRAELLASLASHVAEVGRMQCLEALRADGDGRQAEAATNAAAASTALARLAIREHTTVPTGPVLLLDDTTRSGFTLTVAAELLRAAGSGPVYPLVLCKEF